ncbi:MULTISPECIES: GGDEF domain-containing protein [unclassified Lentilitoribacter]|jgi:diguanylate cyclase|uniref:GGDEF domain-containing protein n=1 Tax=unclassified Lentilitoribacter TaxID=2647570 RepID=UPI0013A6A070|nr:GGDEF domain-containing protein [Lentilitoribacter sp. Alg239-R112]
MNTASIVVATMHKRGISGLPRNYELVYEALNKSNTTLTREFAALGSQPSQGDLDAVGKKYFSHHHHGGVVDSAQEKISGELDDLLGKLNKENTTLQDYTQVLGDNANKLNHMSENPRNKDILSVTEELAQATGDKIENSKAIIDRVLEATKELAQVKEQLDEYKSIANTDPLTQLPNRRAFDEAMSMVYDSNISISTSALILLDIDHFKSFNDTHGHPIGDRVLGVVARAMSTELRDDSLIARTGGEEFGIVVSNTSAGKVELIAERIRLAVEKTSLKDRKSGADYGQITISLGVCMASECNNSEHLYGAADEALYLSKNKGRNQVQVYDPERMKKTNGNRAMYK